MRAVFLLAILISAVSCQNSWGTDLSPETWDKRFTLRGGAIAYKMKGKFSSTKEDRPEIKVDLDDLDLDEYDVAYFLGATVRLGERWRLRLDYFGYHDNAGKTVERTFEFDDLVFDVGARIDSKLDFDLYVVNLGYDIYRSERARFGVGLGAHIVDFDLQVSGTLNVGGAGLGARSAQEDLTTPLPNLYAGGLYAFRNDLLFRYGGGWMSMSYGDYDGNLVFAQGTMEYWPHKNVGIGAGYIYRSADIEYKTSKKKETYDIDMPGPVLYLTVGF